MENGQLPEYRRNVSITPEFSSAAIRLGDYGKEHSKLWK